MLARFDDEIELRKFQITGIDTAIYHVLNRRMKVLRHPHMIQIGLCAAVCLILASCSKSGSSGKMSPEAAKQSRLDWNLKTLVGAYQQAGNTDPVWNEFATNALAEFARDRSHALAPGEPAAEIIATNCDAAIGAGCDDPMVRYLYIRFSMSQTNSPQKFADAFCSVAKDMQKSSYPDVRKFYAAVRAMEQLFYAYGTNDQSMPVAQEIAPFSGQDIMSIVQDKTTTPEEAFEVCEAGLSGLGRSSADYSRGYSMIEPPLFANWPNESTSWLLKGEAFIQMAWGARGNGYANKVTPEGWQTFSNDLAVADSALNRAWKLNPNDARIARHMITVELGQGRGRDRMELWFNRAMDLDPNYYDACSQKLYYLEPKWYGSVEDMLDFGRECVQNTNWGGRVPLILVDAHYNICNEFTDESERTNYWKQPDVWADIKSAYERFFQLHPDDTSSIPYYAWYAYHTENWDKLNELIPKLGPANYAFFGGKDEFDKMVQTAKENSSPPTNPP